MAEINTNKGWGKPVNIGFENRVIDRRIVAIVNPNSAPIKRLINEAKEGHLLLIDSTGGKPKRSVIVTDSGHVILSSISPRNLSARIEKNILD